MRNGRLFKALEVRGVLSCQKPLTKVILKILVWVVGKLLPIPVTRDSSGDSSELATCIVIRLESG